MISYDCSIVTAGIVFGARGIVSHGCLFYMYKEYRATHVRPYEGYLMYRTLKSSPAIVGSSTTVKDMALKTGWLSLASISCPFGAQNPVSCRPYLLQSHLCLTI